MPRRCHYVLSTHWDREWYRTFEDFRFRLAQFMDHVLPALVDGRLRGPVFMDGQAIMLEDYLEARPEAAAQVRELLTAGRLSAGPWYTMPDEHIVSGEALIRNLRFGREMVRNLGGKPSDAGFVCDVFGHNSQLPQILRGFGIATAFAWRGTPDDKQRNFVWQAADGSEVLSYRFGDHAYCSYAESVRHAFAPEHKRPAATREDLETYLQAEAAVTQVDPILLFDGGDHQYWDEPAYGMLIEAMEAPPDGFEVVHTDLDAYIRGALASAERVTACVKGELRYPAQLSGQLDLKWLIPGVLSSRAPIKQSNARCQTVLCRWAEPWTALAGRLAAFPDYAGLLNVAWRALLQNHAHDSICGCSIDAVHRDMAYRFHQAEGIGERLTAEALRLIAARIDAPLAEGEVRAVVFNPSLRPLDEVVELTVDTPAEWPTFAEFFGYEQKPAFRIYDASGAELPYQRLRQEAAKPVMRLAPSSFPEGVTVQPVRVALRLAVPALGYTTLTVRPDAQDRFTRYPTAPGLATDGHTIENESLRVAANGDGSLRLTDKRSGAAYDGLLRFEDCADIGDGWNWGPAINDLPVSSRGSRCEMALESNGAQLATLLVRTHLMLPARFHFETGVRSTEWVDTTIESRVTLRAGADTVEVEMTVDNEAEDHRLRVLFPTGAAADTYLADGPFDVLERPIALCEANHRARELEVDAKPQQTWTAVSDAGRGLAVISTGIMESAVIDAPERPIALTLLRSTRRTVGTAGEPDGLLRGKHTFRLQITPLAGEVDRGRLGELGARLAAGMRTAQLTTHDAEMLRPERLLPVEQSLLRLEGDALVDSFRAVDGALELRVHNPCEALVSATLAIPTGSPLAELLVVERVDFESRPVDGAEPLTGPTHAFSLRPKEIATLRLR